MNGVALFFVGIGTVVLALSLAVMVSRGAFGPARLTRTQRVGVAQAWTITALGCYLASAMFFQSGAWTIVGSLVGFVLITTGNVLALTRSRKFAQIT